MVNGMNIMTDLERAAFVYAELREKFWALPKDERNMLREEKEKGLQSNLLNMMDAAREKLEDEAVNYHGTYRRGGQIETDPV